MDKNNHSKIHIQQTYFIFRNKHIEAERMEKNIPCKQKPKERRRGYIKVRPSRHYDKNYYWRQIMILYNDKIDSPSRIHSNHLHTHTEKQSHKIQEEKSDRIKGYNN